MISKQTAYDIWVCYDEIAKASKLGEDMEKQLRDGEYPSLRDTFGRSRCLQLGVPTFESGHRLYDVQPKLAMSILRAHVAEKQAELVACNERARTELDLKG